MVFICPNFPSVKSPEPQFHLGLHLGATKTQPFLKRASSAIPKRKSDHMNILSRSVLGKSCVFIELTSMCFVLTKWNKNKTWTWGMAVKPAQVIQVWKMKWNIKPENCTIRLGLEAQEAFAVLSAPAPLGSAVFFKLSPAERVLPHLGNGWGEPLFPVNCASKLLPNTIRDKSQQSPLPSELLLISTTPAYRTPRKLVLTKRYNPVSSGCH